MTSTTAPTVMEPPQLAHATGPFAWLRRNLFRTIPDTILTLVVAFILVSLLSRFAAWTVSEAQWAVITENFRVLMQGLYPLDQAWRVALAVVIVLVLAGMSLGIWGRVVASTVVTLLGAAILFMIVPIIDGAAWGESGLGYYLGREVLPLLQVLRLPVLVAMVCLVAGYGAGWIFSRINRRAASRVTLTLWLVSIPVTFFLVRGVGAASPTLPLVPTSLWGGLLLTFMLAFVAIVCCFPLGILLALGRMSGGTQSRRVTRPAYWWLNPAQWPRVLLEGWRNLGHYPVIKLFCVVYIEFLRGVPLVTVFYTANLIVPLALGSTEIDAVVRAMVALTLFEAAYIAEIVRGGLQAIPPGQLEAAKALGLGPIQATLFITLPQALRIVIPALVGQFITMFKDTSLVAIVGLSDLLGIAQSIVAQKEFTGRQREAFVFVAIVYFVFSYGMSRAARQLERSGSGRLRQLGRG